MSNDEKIQQLQLLEQSLQQLLMQKQSFQAQLMEIESAQEGAKTTAEIYKIVGNILIKSKKEDIEIEYAHLQGNPAKLIVEFACTVIVPPNDGLTQGPVVVTV